MSKLMREFKEFAMRGNVMDMAVGIIIGAAFGKIVSSLVKDVVMPSVGMLIGGVDFSQLAWTIQQATAETEAVTINYGVFLLTVLDFLIMALAIFVAIKAMNSLRRREEEKPAEPPRPPRQEVLLEEIRDLLKQRSV